MAKWMYVELKEPTNQAEASRCRREYLRESMGGVWPANVGETDKGTKRRKGNIEMSSK